MCACSLPSALSLTTVMSFAAQVSSGKHLYKQMARKIMCCAVQNETICVILEKALLLETINWYINIAPEQKQLDFTNNPEPSVWKIKVLSHHYLQAPRYNCIPLRYCRLLPESQFVYLVEKSMTNVQRHRAAGPHATLRSQLRLAKKHETLHAVRSGSQSTLPN